MTSVRIIWLLICLLWVGAEIHLARRPVPHQQTLVTSERRSQNRLWLSMLLSLGLAAIFKQLSWLPMPIAYLPRQLLAVLALGGGLGLRYWAISQLGRFFTTHVTIQQQHNLIQSGPYRLLRHPAYTGLLLAFAAAGLAMGDYLALLLLTLLPFQALASRIALEEQMLERAFGDDYRHYCKSTWKLIPGLF